MTTPSEPAAPAFDEDTVERLMAAMEPLIWEREKDTLDIPNETGHHLAWAAGSRPFRRDIARAALAAMKAPGTATADQQVQRVLALADELDAEMEARGFRLDRIVLPGDRIRAAVAGPRRDDTGGQQ